MTVLFFVTQDTDVQKIVGLAELEAEELGIDKKKINYKKLRDTLYACRDLGMLIATYDGDFLSGFIALCPQESFWSDEIGLCQLMYYVHPKCRNGSGLMLLRAAKKFAVKRGQSLTLYLDTLTEIERKEKMFQRLGFRKRGGTFEMEVK